MQLNVCRLLYYEAGGCREKKQIKWTELKTRSCVCCAMESSFCMHVFRQRALVRLWWSPLWSCICWVCPRFINSDSIWWLCLLHLFFRFDEFVLIRQAILLTIETFGFSIILSVFGLPLLIPIHSQTPRAHGAKRHQLFQVRFRYLGSSLVHYIINIHQQVVQSYFL